MNLRIPISQKVKQQEVCGSTRKKIKGAIRRANIQVNHSIAKESIWLARNGTVVPKVRDVNFWVTICMQEEI